MKKKRALAASRDPDHETSTHRYVFRENPNLESNSIYIHCASEEMLRIGPDGFYVRGVKLKQDDKEAELVYNAFREFLTYHALTRSY